MPHLSQISFPTPSAKQLSKKAVFNSSASVDLTAIDSHRFTGNFSTKDESEFCLDALISVPPEQTDISTTLRIHRFALASNDRE